jgi:transposase
MKRRATVRAWRSRRRIAAKEREVVVFSPQIYEGQLRRLHQHAVRVSEELQEMRFHPRGTPEAIPRKIAKICGRQYIRTLVRWEVVSAEPGWAQVRLWSEVEKYRRLQTRYFGLRILVSNRSEWSTAEIFEAYRGQAKTESAFRNLKDPGMPTTRPQFYWTDQKLHVHAFMCVTGYLLVRLLWWLVRRKMAIAGRGIQTVIILAESRGYS